MLSYRQKPGRVRRADDMLPTSEGGLETRPGAMQILDGPVDGAVPWGGRLVCSRYGRIQVWTGASTQGSVHDIAPSGPLLVGTSFQALTENAEREDRCYIGDGINPVSYIAYRNGKYERQWFDNSVTDENGVPYPLPAPTALATWRNRLWAAYGANRAQHCQNDDPTQWDPLWTVECQGSQPDRIEALMPMGGRLLSGLRNSVWAITGDSRYNFQREEVAKAVGAAGPYSMFVAGDEAWHLAGSGIYRLGDAAPRSKDMEGFFSANARLAQGSIVIDTIRRLALIAAYGRCLVMHLDTGRFGEIKGAVQGVFELQDYVGWYGSEGAWLLVAKDTDDYLADGTWRPFTADLESWDERPNPNGDGRAWLPRTVLTLAGSVRGTATYTVTRRDDGEEATASREGITLTDEVFETWDDIPTGAEGEPWPLAQVRREIPVQLAGETFRHRLSARCHMELKHFDPLYHFEQEESAA